MKKSSRAAKLLLSLVMLVLVLASLTVASSALTTSSGYTYNSSSDKVAYKQSSNTVDVNGKYNGSWIQTTYGNNGYSVTYDCSSGNMSVSVNPTIVQNGNYVKLTYTVTAGSSGVTGGRVGAHADVMIGNDDSATITILRDSSNNPIGLQMTNTRSGSSYNAQYRLYFDGVAGVTPISTYWFGRFSDRTSNCFNQTNSNSLSGTDSGVAFSWQNINLGAYESKSFSVLLGVGAVQQQIVIPSDPSSSNISLSGCYGSEAKFDASMSFTDPNSGVTDELKCMVGSNEYTIASAYSNGGSQTLSGTLDLSELSDGTYDASFWIYNSNGAISPAVNRTIVIENGSIVSGLNEGCVDVNLVVDYPYWNEAYDDVMIGTSLSSAVPNGSLLENGTYNVYLLGHLAGTVTVDGGYTYAEIDFEPIEVDDISSIDVSVPAGTPASEIILPETVTLRSYEGLTYTVRVNWNHLYDVYEYEGYETVYGTISEIVDYEYLGMYDGIFNLYDDITANINVLHVHTFDSYTNPATCTNTGEVINYCYCGHEEIAEIIPALGHTLSNFVVDYEATCSTAGQRHAVCSECESGAIYEIIPATGHNTVETERIEATCTENGYIETVCQKPECGEIRREIIYAHGHSFDVDNECTECGFVLEIHEHDFTTDVTEATCYSMGYTTYVCHCGYSYDGFYVEPLRHAWSEGTVTQKTCTSDGKTVYYCENNGCDAFMEIIDPAAHSFVDHDFIPETCTEDGSLTKVCSECGAEEKVIIPAAHDWQSEDIITEPGCETKGEVHRICFACGTEENFEVDVLGHNFRNGSCTRCDARIPDVVVPSAGSSLYGMFFKIDDIISNYGPDYVNEYGVMLDYNEDANLKRVAVYLTQDGTMWRRCIAVVGDNITYATYVPYLSYGEDIKYTGQTSPYINTFSLKKNSDGIWCYNDYATIGVNLEDMYGNLLLSLYNIGQAGAQTRIFDDLDEMKEWLKYGDAEEDHTHEMGEWYTVTEVSCMKSGVDRRDCSGCDFYETRVNERFGEHALVYHMAQMPTEDSVGWNAYESCIRCDYTTYEEIPALGTDDEPETPDLPIEPDTPDTPDIPDIPGYPGSSTDPDDSEDSKPGDFEKPDDDFNDLLNPDNPIHSMGFEELVASIGGSMNERYALINLAASKYNSFTEEEKEAVSASYELLMQYAENYNNDAESISETHLEAKNTIVEVILNYSAMFSAAYVPTKTKGGNE